MITISLALLAAGAAGCSDDDSSSNGGGGAGGGGGSGGSGGGAALPPGDTALSDLTDAQITALCEANKATLEALSGAACLIGLGLAEDNEADCEAAVANCPLNADGGSIEIDCSDTSIVDYSGCDATVDELLDCGDPIVTYANGLSCANAGPDPFADEPQCSKDLAAQCPDVYNTSN